MLRNDDILDQEPDRPELWGFIFFNKKGNPWKRYTVQVVNTYTWNLVHHYQMITSVINAGAI